MKHRPQIPLVLLGLILASLACQAVTGLPPAIGTAEPLTPTLTPIPTPLPPAPVQPGAANPDEPVFITGDIPYTSPFFLDTIGEPFVLLEDQAGFVRRDIEFEFSLQGQAIGPVEVHEDQTLTFSLALPAVPQGTQVDVDNNADSGAGVQVFAVAYWSNTWGGPFLEERDGSGWSSAYASTVTDPDQDNEITGGTLVVWAPDGDQAFPTGFGEDGKLFTADDPTAPIPAGYNLVNLDEQPFQIYKEARPKLVLQEGDLAVNDFSQMGYAEAFQAVFDKASVEYPFTEEKSIDWGKLHDEFLPRFEQAETPEDFYRAMRDFTWQIPDAHVGMSFNADIFFEEAGGSFGLVLAELSDKRVIVTHVLPETPGEAAGIQVGAEIKTWEGQPVTEAIDQVVPYFGPYSTAHHRRLEQVVFLTRVPPDTQVQLTYQNPGEAEAKEATLKAEVEYDSLFTAIPTFQQDEVAPPIEAQVLDDSGLGYIRINTFSADYSLMARLWEFYLQGFIDNQVPGLIIDVRVNSGGSGTLALDFAGYFFDHEIQISTESYYNELTQTFEPDEYPSRIQPAPFQFDGPVALLVSPYCVSACEGFSYAVSREGRAKVVGHFPTAGAFGEVGRGQYDLPDEVSMQFPTGRPVTPEGGVLIEGAGVPLDVTVPVTEDSALGRSDTVLEKAVEELQAEIK